MGWAEAGLGSDSTMFSSRCSGTVIVKPCACLSATPLHPSRWIPAYLPAQSRPQACFASAVCSAQLAHSLYRAEFFPRLQHRSACPEIQIPKTLSVWLSNPSAGISTISPFSRARDVVIHPWQWWGAAVDVSQLVLGRWATVLLHKAPEEGRFKAKREYVLRRYFG